LSDLHFGGLNRGRHRLYERLGRGPSGGVLLPAAVGVYRILPGVLAHAFAGARIWPAADRPPKLLLDGPGSPGPLNALGSNPYPPHVFHPSAALCALASGYLQLRPVVLSVPDGISQTVSALLDCIPGPASAGLLPSGPRTRTPGRGAGTQDLRIATAIG